MTVAGGQTTEEDSPPQSFRPLSSDVCPPESGGFCCQVPPNPACRSLTRQDFNSVFRTALRSQGHRSIVVVGNYEFGPITAEPCRAKARPLHPRRSCFGPIVRGQITDVGGRRGQAPFPSFVIRPLSSVLCHPSFVIRHLSSGGAAGYCPRVRMVYYDSHLSP